MGIIGVVAAITIPTLISNTNSAKFRTQFKKTLSTLNQAARMSQVQYDFDFATTSEESLHDRLDPQSHATVGSLLMGTLRGVNPLKTPDGKLYRPEVMAFPTIGFNHIVMPDGSIFGWTYFAFNCTVPPGENTIEYLINHNSYNSGNVECSGYIDVNGTAGPNVNVLCENPGDTDLYDGTNDCTVPNDTAHIKDVYPVIFHDGVVEPATNAARYVLSTTR